MAGIDSRQLHTVLNETRRFKPSAAFKKQAYIKSEAEYLRLYRESIRNPAKFWGRAAGELHWFKKWSTVLDEKKAPFYRWFVGGKTNITYNCLDRHLDSEIRHKAAIVWEGEPGDRRVLTYADLAREVNLLANGLKKLGVKKGDRVAIYLGMVPELVVSLLACARIGAVHSVIFAGFSAESIRDRVLDCQAKAVITSDGGWRRGNLLPLKDIVDEAITSCPSVKSVVVVQRSHGPFPCKMQDGRDHWYHELVKGLSADCPPEKMDSEDMLFLLYTSGTTGKPKGVIHTIGGYMVFTYLSMKYIFDIKSQDMFWCTADIGWVTGHSYIVYGPLQNAATCLVYEGAPDFPNRGRIWELIERYKVSILYTAPTAIRAFMKWGDEWPKAHDLSSLRLLGSVGEPINPEAWMWYHEKIGYKKCPIVDTWWQTETGGILITPLPGITATKPGSATLPFFGIDATILSEDGREVDAGYLAIRRPWPGMLGGIYGDPERYKQTYWTKWPGVYFPGDGARRDKHGFFWIVGRVDDVVNVAGHRIGTAELESVFVEHRSVAESAVIGVKHDLKGQAMVAFVSLKDGVAGTEALNDELRDWIAVKIGKFAIPERIVFAHDLPKTRSGKIMRRLLRDVAEGRALGNVTTLADASVVAKLKSQYADDE
jgi:acetyl-CoA synthetase